MSATWEPPHSTATSKPSPKPQPTFAFPKQRKEPLGEPATSGARSPASTR